VNRRRRAGVAGLAAAVLLLLSGCFSGSFPLGPDGTLEPTAAPDPAAPVDPALAPYYEQDVAWQDCEDGFECTTVTAPMDWEDPVGTDIEVAMVRHRATGDKIGSLFMNPGGPGASGYDYVRDYLDYFFSPELIERFDIVGWDPRGVGRTTPVTCYTDPEDIEEFLYGVPEHDWRTEPEAYAAELDAAGRDYAEACAEGTGEVLGYIDTGSTVRDLDLLRALVGDPKLHYIGFSYGTEIGQRYIAEFPEHVGRIVLDGVTDVSLPLFDLVLEQNIGFERALTNYVTLCPELFGSDCPFTGSTARDLARINGIVTRYAEQPIPSTVPGDDRVMDGWVVNTAINDALYSQSLWPDLNELFRELEATPPSTEMAFTLADEYYGFIPGVGYADNFFDAFLAISCLDAPVERDPAVLEEQAERLREAAPTTWIDGPVMPDVICGNWLYPPRAPDPEPVTGEGVPPVLVVSTTGDPATPYEWGVRVAERLESGVLVSVHAEGHTAYSAWGDRCVVSTVDDYLIEGRAPTSDPNCGA